MDSTETYLLFKTSASNCCLVTKWYSTPSFSCGFLGLVVSVGTQEYLSDISRVLVIHLGKCKMWSDSRGTATA